MENTSFKKSETIDKLAKALMAFQTKVGKVTKDATNPFFKSKYASLEAVIDAIKGPLADAKLSYVQLPTGENQLVTILMHESGEFMESTIKMTPKTNDPQGQGSAITYMRRYALSAMLGLATEDDDDGNSATGNKTTAPAKDDKAPAGTSIFEQAKKNLAKMTDKKLLEEFKGKIEKSTKYKPNEKKDLYDIIDKTIKSLK